MKSQIANRSTLSVLATITSLVILTACGNPPGQQTADFNTSGSQGIVNGTAVEKSDSVAKSTAAIYIQFPQSERISHFCTATLIGHRVLTTAAHCLLGVADATGMTVEELTPFLRIGFGLKRSMSLADKDVQFIKLSGVRVHPGFHLDALVGANEQTAIPDIAVLQMEQDAPANYKAAKLLRDESVITPGADLILAGYGLTSGPPAPIQALELRRVDVQVLKAKFNPVQFSYEVSQGKTACSGDSGGPAFLSSSASSDLILVGVTSFGDNQCLSLGVYTSVPAMVAWIDEQVESFEEPSDLPDPSLVAQL